MNNNPSAALSEALNAFPDPVFIIAKDGTCLFWNTASEHLLARNNLQTLSAKDFWPRFNEVSWQTGAEITDEFRRPDSSSVVVKMAIYPGEYLTVRILSSFSASDEARNFHAQRLESLGLLASGVAHDFNNVLTGIMGHVTYLKSVLPSSGNHVESIKAIEDGAIKGSSMTQQIVRFTKLDTEERSAKVDLGDLVVRTCTLLRGAIPSQHKLVWSIAEEGISVLASEGKVAQVLINLIVNGRDALNGSGTITAVLRVSRDSREIAGAFKVKEDEIPAHAYAVLEVRDNGQGISEDVIGKIFDPYFSTKKEKGTGLGLSTVRSIVRSLAGAITVSSVVGVGTAFRVFLPLLEATQADTQLSEDEPVPGKGERILVVDDESAVRNVLSLSLEHLGYVVETAASGMEALEKFSEFSGRFDLVLLDMLMPGLSGPEVFFKLKRIKPEVKVLVVSGFSSENAVRSVLDNGGLDYIQKPFTMEVLSKKVRGCLE